MTIILLKFIFTSSYKINKIIKNYVYQKTYQMSDNIGNNKSYYLCISVVTKNSV